MPQQGLNESPFEGVVGYIITKTILVQFRGLFYIILAPNSSYQERRFRPYDVD